MQIGIAGQQPPFVNKNQGISGSGDALSLQQTPNMNKSKINLFENTKYPYIKHNNLTN
jgi:hypothetical protein